MKNFVVILGHITFLQTSLGDAKNEAIVHKIDEMVICDEKAIDDNAETKWLDEHESYLVIGMYNDPITFECKQPEFEINTI